MHGHEEIKKKYISSNSANSLLSMKDYRKPAVSREKSKNKPKDNPDELHPKPASFRSIRDNIPKHEQPPKTRTEHSRHDHSVHGHPKQEHSKQPVLPHDHNHGISINVNIQNLITPKNVQNLKMAPLDKEEVTPKIERPAQLQAKKPRKISNLRPDPDSFEFQCSEELIYKKSTSSEQNVRPKTIPSESKNIPSDLTLRKKDKEKDKAVDPKEVLKKFEAQMEQINSSSGYESLMYLTSRQQQYMVHPDYIEKNQKNFNWLMRAFLVEWIMQVCYEFALKRETFHIAINLIDRFLQKQSNIPKSEFQLVGLAAMLIASKIEEDAKSLEEFVKSANHSYSVKKVEEMEQRIVKVLRYFLHPPTLFRWGNRLMVQWDTFLKEDAYAQRHPVLVGKTPVHFKQCDEQSYINFRQLMQMLDCSLLDIETSEYSPKLLVCGFMYLIIGKQMGLFTAKEIVKQFPGSSLYLLDEDCLFNDLFGNFMHFTFGLPLIDLLPVVQYCATYFLLPPNVDKPMTPDEDALQTMQLEEYCSFQTFDRNMYIVIKKRARGVCI